MAIVKERVRPRGVRGGRARQSRAPNVDAKPPVRQSKRLIDKKQRLVDVKLVASSGTDTDCSSASSTSRVSDAQPDAQGDLDGLEEAQRNPARFFNIAFSLSMEFNGLLATYKIVCPDAGCYKEGLISLPDRYSFGVA